MIHFPNPYPIHEANLTIWLFREAPPAYESGGLNPALGANQIVASWIHHIKDLFPNPAGIEYH